MKLMSTSAYEQAAHCLKVLGHPQRIKMLQYLLDDEHTVGELAQLCGIADNVTSEHLRLMERCGFLKRHKKVREVFYQVSEKHIEKILACIEERFSNKAEKR